MQALNYIIRKALFSLVLLGLIVPTWSLASIHDAQIGNISALHKADTSNTDQVFPVTVSALNQKMLIELEFSRFNSAVQRYSNSQVTSTTANTPILFQGTIKGDNTSWARLSLLDEKLFGQIFHAGKLYQLEHSNYLDSNSIDHKTNSEYVLIESANTTPTSNILSTVVTRPDYIAFAPNYRSSNAPLVATQSASTSFASSQRKNDSANSIALLKSDGLGTSVTRALRVGIFIDSLFDEAHKKRGLARALTIMNGVDAIYQQELGIAIIIEAVSVHTDANTDPMRNRSGSVKQVLESFRNIRANDVNLPADLSLVHLFTGHQDPDRVIGLGWKSTTCRLDGFDISVSTPFPFDTLLAAHEIAHNLGAVHDDDVRCAANPSSSQSTLMWPGISSNSTSEFSSCSIDFMQSAKDAECNLNNIDASVAILSYPSSETLRRSVVIEVSNNDAFGRGTELYSTTNFPSGTRFQDLSAGCNVVNTSVECNHGAVAAKRVNRVAVTATLPNDIDENVTSKVELLNAADINDNDNRTAIYLLQAVENTEFAFASDAIFLQDGNESTENELFASVGKASYWMLAFMATIVWVRRKRKELD